MRVQKSLSSFAVSMCAAMLLSASLPISVFGQGSPNVSAVTLQVFPGQTGQTVLTPKGMLVPLPGPGVNGNAVQIFMGSQGGFWYVDRNGQNVDLTPAVMQYRQMTGQVQTTQQIPQYAPVAPPPQQVTNNYSSGGGGSSAAGTAAMAGLGAMAGGMAGAAIGNSYNNVPYGTPMYYPHGASPYYMNGSGQPVNVDNAHNTYAAQNNAQQYQAQQNAQKYEQQQNVEKYAQQQNAQKYEQQQNAGKYAQQHQGGYNNQQAENMQKQQQWYSQQQKNPEQAKQWSQVSENPFAKEGAKFQGSTADGAEEGRRGRFGRGGREAGGAGKAEEERGRLRRR